MGHGSLSVSVWHSEQQRTSRTTPVTAFARSAAYPGPALMMWKARRCAVFSPMPGRRASSFTNRAMGSATAISIRQSGDLDPARRLLEVLVGGEARLLGARVHRRGDEV